MSVFLHWNLNGGDFVLQDSENVENALEILKNFEMLTFLV